MVPCATRLVAGALPQPSPWRKGDLTKLSMKSVAWALVLAASAVDMAVPLLVVPALVLGVSTAAHAAPAAETATRREVVSYRA